MWIAEDCFTPDYQISSGYTSPNRFKSASYLIPISLFHTQRYPERLYINVLMKIKAYYAEHSVCHTIVSLLNCGYY